MIHYLYDEAQSIAKFDNTGKVISQHIHGSGLGGDVRSLVYKEALNSKNEVDTSYFFYNYRGDVIDVTTDDTKISYRYDAFGRIIGSSYPELGFSSKRFDESIGLSYFGARCYDAFIGRFISRDPIGYIDGANQYIYVANNPLRFIDPWGYNARMTNASYRYNVASLSTIYQPEWGIDDIDPNPGLQDPGDNITYIEDRDPNQFIEGIPIEKKKPEDYIIDGPGAHGDFKPPLHEIHTFPEYTDDGIYRNDGNVGQGNNQGQSDDQTHPIPPDGTTMGIGEALDEAEEFLGPGYKENLGGFVSEDGKRRVRMGDGELSGDHAGGVHLNFEEGEKITDYKGREVFDDKTNHHIFIK